MTSPVDVRSARTTAEVSAAMDLLDATFADHPGWSAVRRNVRATAEADPEATAIAVTADGEVVGTVTTNGRSGIDGVAVLESQRGLGLGARLLRLAEDVLRSRGVTGCVLGSADTATGFYVKAGYVATLLLQYPPGETDLEARLDRIQAELLGDLPCTRSEWDGRARLAVDVPDVDHDLSARIRTFDPGVVPQFVMGKQLS